MKFSFVILHYNALPDTIECIDSIKKCVGADCGIVVVDNKSPNGTGVELDAKYRDDAQVTVILNPENEGFARGNNVGFRYAKEHQNPDFIVMLNNDTMILQDDFAERVEKEYEQSHFAVLGPVIKTPHKPYSSNPGPSKLPSENWYKKYVRKVSFKLFLNRIFGLDAAYEWLLRKLLGQKDKKFDESLLERRAENVLLHGSFLIFSPAPAAERHEIRLYAGYRDFPQGRCRDEDRFGKKPPEAPFPIQALHQFGKSHARCNAEWRKLVYIKRVR